MAFVANRNYIVPMLKFIALVVMIVGSLFAASRAFQVFGARNATVLHALIDQFAATNLLGAQTALSFVASLCDLSAALGVAFDPTFGVLIALLAILRISGASSFVIAQFHQRESWR